MSVLYCGSEFGSDSSFVSGSDFGSSSANDSDSDWLLSDYDSFSDTFFTSVSGTLTLIPAMSLIVPLSLTLALDLILTLTQSLTLSLTLFWSYFPRSDPDSVLFCPMDRRQNPFYFCLWHCLCL